MFTSGEGANASSQLWIVEPANDGRVKIKSNLAGKCLDLVNMNTENGAVLQIWADVNGDNQYWTINEVTRKPKTSAKATAAKAKAEVKAAAESAAKTVDAAAKAAAEVATEVVDAVKASADKPVAETAAEVVKTAKKATCKTSTKKAAEAAVTTAKKAAEAATAVAAVATDAVKEVAEKPAVKAAADEAVKAVKEVAEKPAVKAAVEAADKAVKEVAEKPAVKAAAKAADEAVKTVVEAAKPVVEAAKPAVKGKKLPQKAQQKVIYFKSSEYPLIKNKSRPQHPSLPGGTFLCRINPKENCPYHSGQNRKGCGQLFYQNNGNKRKPNFTGSSGSRFSGRSKSAQGRQCAPKRRGTYRQTRHQP